MLNDKDYLWEGDTFPDGYGQLMGGALGLGVGIPMIIGGSVLRSIGNKKYRKYKKMLNVSMSYNSFLITVSF